MEKKTTGKYSMDTVFGELLKDPRVVAIIRNTCPSVFSNPRVGEVYNNTLGEILEMDVADVAGLTQSKLKKMFKEVIALD